MSKQKKSDNTSSTIALNKLARHDYIIEDKFEAGIVLEGWEVKAIRAGRVQLRDSYVFLKDGEAWLLSTTITPLLSASTHVKPEQMRMRKLLLHRYELNRLVGAVERKGYTLIATAMYWKQGRVKVEVGLAKGKKTHDKRASEKDRDWKIEKQRILKRG